MESAASWASAGNSACSSVMMIKAGSSGAGSCTRFPAAALSRAWWLSDATASRNSLVASSGVVASRSKRAAHGWSSIPLFRSTPHSATSRHAARVAMMMFRIPDFPAPAIPATRTLGRKSRTRTGRPSSATATTESTTGYRHCRLCGTRHWRATCGENRMRRSEGVAGKGPHPHRERDLAAQPTLSPMCQAVGGGDQSFVTMMPTLSEPVTCLRHTIAWLRSWRAVQRTYFGRPARVDAT